MMMHRYMSYSDDSFMYIADYKIKLKSQSHFTHIYLNFFLHPVQDHSSEDEDDDKYADDFDMPGQNFDSKRRITVRNLRIREDIAKVKITNEC